MTANEYFALALPTDADFAAWTRSLFDRAERAKRRFAANHPELVEKSIDGLALFEGDN